MHYHIPESLKRVDVQRLSEEIGDILEARQMLDDELPLRDPIAHPVETHVQ